MVGTCRWQHSLNSAGVIFAGLGRPVADSKSAPDPAGNFSFDIAVPADLEPGSYIAGAGCFNVSNGNDVAVNVDQGYGQEVQVALDAAPEPRPVLDFVALAAGGSVILARGAHLDRVALPVAGTISGPANAWGAPGLYSPPTPYRSLVGNPPTSSACR